jgi:hypothetical protein
MNFYARAGQQVFSLILGPDEAGPPRLLPLFIEYLYLTIGKKIHSNTHCPTCIPDFMNKPD